MVGVLMPVCRWEDILGFLIYRRFFPPHGHHGLLPFPLREDTFRKRRKESERSTPRILTTSPDSRSESLICTTACAIGDAFRLWVLSTLSTASTIQGLILLI